jgi:type II secretory pathway component GspD/PulD (secretin)
VVTLNNQPALIKVATDQPFFTSTVSQGTAGTGNIVTEQVRSVTVGLVLSVTPQISEDGWIMLDVTPIISRLREIVDSPQETANAPVLDVKQSSGLVRLKDGEMVIIGGLIQEESSDTERKVPILGDIPYLGRLFKGTYTVKSKSELVIFLSPKIVRSSS